MVTVKIRRDGAGRLSSLEAVGHAGWAKYGSDVVCAAVSTVLQTAQLGLEQVAGVPVKARKSAARLDLAWPAPARDRHDVRAIAETAAAALDALARQFPEHVVAVSEDEPAGESSGRAAKGAP